MTTSNPLFYELNPRDQISKSGILEEEPRLPPQVPGEKPTMVTVPPPTKHNPNAHLDHHYPSTFSLHAELETVREVVIAMVLGLWGILVAVVTSLIPRSFRAKDVNGKIVLITGAGSGIGRLMAKKFAIEHKAIVVCWDINKEGNDVTVKEIKANGGKAHSYVVDVSARSKIYEAADKVKKEVGKVDILINNAGIVSGNKSFLDTNDDLIEKTFAVNSLANFWTTKAFLPGMVADGSGHIVTIASLAGLFGINRLVDYCASKFAAVGFDESLRNELRVEMADKDLHTSVVCPYFINTGMFDGVKSKVLPILNPQDVCDDIVAGVLCNQEQIIIPRYTSALVLLKYLLPGEVGRKIATAAGVTSTMMDFHGRTPVAKNGVQKKTS